MDRDMAVITSKQIIELHMPILYVYYGSDGYWQFLSGDEIDDSDGRIVTIEEILSIDTTLAKLSWLTMGMEANRDSVSSEWQVRVVK